MELKRFLCYLPILSFESDVICAETASAARAKYAEQRKVPYEYKNRIVSRQLSASKAKNPIG